jgi:hypothetical protein
LSITLTKLIETIDFSGTAMRDTPPHSFRSSRSDTATLLREVNVGAGESIAVLLPKTQLDRPVPVHVRGREDHLQQSPSLGARPASNEST